MTTISAFALGADFGMILVMLLHHFIIGRHYTRERREVFAKLRAESLERDKALAALIADYERSTGRKLYVPQTELAN